MKDAKDIGLHDKRHLVSIWGMVIIGVVAGRFARTAKKIDAKKVYPGTGRRTDFAPAALLVMLCAGLIVYLFHAITKSA